MHSYRWENWDLGVKKKNNKKRIQQPCSVTYSHYGSWSWNQLGVERTGLAKILGFGDFLKLKEKNKTASFQRKKWDHISLTSGLHLWVLLKHLLISLYPFPILGKVPSNPSELPPGVDAFVLIGGTSDLIPSKVMSEIWLPYKRHHLSTLEGDSLIGFEKIGHYTKRAYGIEFCHEAEGTWKWIFPQLSFKSDHNSSP